MWFLMDDLKVTDTDRNTIYDVSQLEKPSNILHFYALPNHVLFLSNGNDIHLIHTGTHQTITLPASQIPVKLHINSVRSIEENIWLALDGGLIKIKPNWYTQQFETQWVKTHKAILAIEPDQNNRIAYGWEHQTDYIPLIYNQNYGVKIRIKKHSFQGQSIA